MTDEIMKTEGIITEERPDWMEIEEGDNRGSEEVTHEDLIIPRLSIIQGLSPELKKKDPAYIEGAEIGMIFNTVTRELYGDSVVVIPVLFKKFYIIWKLRDEGGGFAGQYDTFKEAENALVEFEDPNKYEIVDTPTNLCLLPNGQEVMVPMPKSKAKVARQWNSLVRMAGGPRWSRAYKLYTVDETSDKGDYVNYAVAMIGYPSKELFDKATELYEQITSGAVNVSMNEDEPF